VEGVAADPNYRLSVTVKRRVHWHGTLDFDACVLVAELICHTSKNS
jgi:hypothetical protein